MEENQSRQQKARPLFVRVGKFLPKWFLPLFFTRFLPSGKNGFLPLFAGKNGKNYKICQDLRRFTLVVIPKPAKKSNVTDTQECCIKVFKSLSKQSHYPLSPSYTFKLTKVLYKQPSLSPPPVFPIVSSTKSSINISLPACSLSHYFHKQ